MNIYHNLYWYVERSVGDKVGRCIAVMVNRNFDAEVGSGDGGGVEL